MLTGSAFSSFCQTTLQAGDIAFVAIQSGETPKSFLQTMQSLILNR